MNALFIKPSSLGDIVHGLQLAESLKREIDDLKIFLENPKIWRKNNA